MPAQNQSLRRILQTPLALLLLGLAAIYVPAMFNHSLIPSMEPRFAEVVKEMTAGHQYLIPLKNGRPYVEYPPLLYWLAVAGHSVGLPIIAAIRLPVYVALLLWVLWLSRLQRSLEIDWPDYGLALTAVAAPGILYTFFLAQTDGLLILGTLIAYAGFFRHRLASDRRFPWELWAGVTLATAAKGPVGVAVTLPAMLIEIGLAGVLDHGFSLRAFGWAIDESRRMAWLRGLALTLLFNAPWYVVAGFVRGWDFIRAVLVYQNFDRYVTGFDHLEPWWDYFKTISTDLFPLSLFIPFGIYYSLKRVREGPYRLLLVWAIYTFAFFTLSLSKQGKYIFPAAPAFIALGLIGFFGLFRSRRTRAWQWLRGWAIGFIALWGVTVVAVLPFFSQKIAAVEGFAVIREAIAAAPGNIVHYRWPRSLTMYELGGPMDFVRSARELYERIHAGTIKAGDYVLVPEKYVGRGPRDRDRRRLVPPPAPPYMELVMKIEAEHPTRLYRILPGAVDQAPPATPEPPAVFWRDAMFDTD